MSLPRIMFMGEPVTLDLSDYMKKSVYDTNNDGIVDKISKITDIEELSTGYFEDAVPKSDATGETGWAEDIGGEIDEVDGGVI